MTALDAATGEHPERREAQRALARAVTALVHGDDQVQRAERAAQVLFGEDIRSADGGRCADGVRRCAVNRADRCPLMA